MINNIKGLQIVDYIGQGKGRFQAIVKVQAGYMVAAEIGDQIPSLGRWKKGALHSIQFMAEGTVYWTTVFARKGKKVMVMDRALAEQLKVGVVNQLFYDTNLMDPIQYRSVNAKTWEDKVFVMNEK